eukprot:GHVL01019795.1.p1 GENE.GHVL01019795.1~~GHVL01019795.1.p1  ORF type:complete len:487 (+),score=136.52 GHVL01019795.1:38-1498(+)
MTILDKIIETKTKEVELLKEYLKNHPDDELNILMKKLENTNQKNNIINRKFENALRRPGLSIIAEVKRKSPSAGNISDINDPINLSNIYYNSNASCLSCLTDNIYFGGHINDLKNIVNNINIPIIRKDFIIDPIQISESILAGASCILLIVSVLKENTKKFIEYSNILGIEALVEVHNEDEMKIAIASKARMIGVNNRNLQNFVTDLSVSEKMISLYPPGVVRISESGITSPEDGGRMAMAGYDAVLVGEALVRADCPKSFIYEMKKKKNVKSRPLIKICGICDVDTAVKTANSGAHIIGLIFEKSSKRFLGERWSEIGKNIIDTVKIVSPNVEIWGVFANHTLEDIISVTQTLLLDGIQLHSQQTRKLLPHILSINPNYRIIYTIQASFDGIIDIYDIENIKLLRDCDYILYDSINPGSGEQFNWNCFKPCDRPFFLAGGLTCASVVDAIKYINPWGVDVSSGVESEPGKKDIYKIEEFISSVQL